MSDIDSSIERGEARPAVSGVSLDEMKKQLLIAKRKLDHLNEENILINTSILKHLKNGGKVNPVSPSKDEGLQKLKSEIEMLVSSGKNYSYKSPEEAFEEQLLKEFSHEESAPGYIRTAVGRLRSRDPLIFTSGRHHMMNYDALAEARDYVRDELRVQRENREKQERLEREEKERRRQERIRIAQEKKARRRPWSKSNQKEENRDSPFSGLFASPTSTLSTGKPIALPPSLSPIIDQPTKVKDNKGKRPSDTESKEKIKIIYRPPNGGSKSTTKLVKDLIGKKTYDDTSNSMLSQGANKPLKPLHTAGK